MTRGSIGPPLRCPVRPGVRSSRQFYRSLPGRSCRWAPCVVLGGAGHLMEIRYLQPSTSLLGPTPADANGCSYTARLTGRGGLPPPYAAPIPDHKRRRPAPPEGRYGPPTHRLPGVGELPSPFFFPRRPLTEACAV